jgi:hypothetical protein
MERIMNKLATLAVAIALAVAGNMAFAAGDSGGGDSGGGGGDSGGGGDNSMSRWTGESYKAFEEARKGGTGTVTITQAPRFKSAERVERPRIAHLPRKPIATDPFRGSDS